MDSRPQKRRSVAPVKTVTGTAPATGSSLLHRLFSGSFGAFLGLSLLKFGNPAIMERFVVVPTDLYEFVLGFPWPIAWGYGLLAGLVILGLKAGHWSKSQPSWLAFVPVAWFGWQLIASAQSVDPSLSGPAVKHFAACSICFYLGFLALACSGLNRAFWVGLLVPLVIVLGVGWHQHFGGLKATREYFYAYIYPELKEIPPEYLKKVTSDRIFSTLFYPNTLAGALLLFGPVFLLNVWRLGRDGRMTLAARLFVLLVAAAAILGCLFWSGSKAGWLLAIVLGMVALWHVRWPRTIRLALIIPVVVVGLAGFFWKYAGFFERGATSVGARFDYWQAAVTTTMNRPLLGSGPGTFAVTYAQLKRPESEMARLAHNDYLQLGSDSGIPATVMYALLFGVGLAVSRRNLAGAGWGDDCQKAVPLALWLGVLAFALQGLVEFGLYIPALSWTAFSFLGWLIGRAK